MISEIIKSFYPYFLPLVLYGIFLRVHEKKWSRAETLLILLFLGHTALLLLQIILSGGGYSRRYFLTAIPLVFGWAGYALYDLSRYRIIRRLIPVCLLVLAGFALRPSLEHYWKKSKKEELFVIRELSPVIRRDWLGKDRFYTPAISWNHYHSPKRPLVQCERYPFLGYASGGSCMLQEDTALPLPDYCIFENEPVPAPYTDIHQIIYQDRIYRVGRLTK